MPTFGSYNFKYALKTPLFIDKDSLTVENMYVTNSTLSKDMSVSETTTKHQTATSKYNNYSRNLL